MVKIINGEIVQDNDPRLRNIGGNRRENNGNNGQRIYNLNSINNNNNNNNNENFSSSSSSSFSSSSNQNSPQTPNNNLYPQNNRNIQQTSQNPLDLLAKVLKIEDRTIIIPAIPQLKLTESKIGLIYFIILGLLCLIFGFKTILFGVFVYVIFKHSEKKNG